MTKPTDTPPDVSLRPRQGAAALPSTDEVLGAMQPLAQRYGTFLTGVVVREFLDEARDRLRQGHDPASCWPPDSLALKATLESRLARRSAARLRPVFNLTGTVLHTNLGRAPLPPAAVAAVSAVMAQACNLEYDIEEGGRGERDHLVETWLCQLTGAEAATVVNNNAAAVLLILNTLATRKEVVVSRGELIEIGGAFRIPDIMARAGARLREVGTTNRTHARDYEEAINDRTALLMKVHPSNYAIEGFTRQVAEPDMAALAHRHELPLVVDLGSGSLVDLRDFGLPHEPTVRETLAAGADLVCFSGDKLLGGPQAGIVAGRADLIARLRKNPLKRALRVDKMTLAALEAVLRLHLNPGTLRDTHTGLRLLTRAYEDIHAVGERLLPPLSAALAGNATVDLRDCHSQIGSGSLPVDRLPSTALVISPVPAGKGAGGRLKSLEKRLRALPIPVIGRVQDGALWLDLRCLTDEAGFLGQLPSLHSC